MILVNMKAPGECVATERPEPELTVEPESTQDVDKVTRTRSGRRVRTPALLADSQVPSPAKPSTRRTRKSVLSLAKGELEAEHSMTSISEAPVGDSTDSPTILGNESTNSVGRAPSTMETAPVRPDEKPQVTALFVPGTKQTTAAPIPPGKPKSGRVWKDRNKQRWVVALPSINSPSNTHVVIVKRCHQNLVCFDHSTFVQVLRSGQG